MRRRGRGGKQFRAITVGKISPAKYPNFNQLQCVIDSGLDWSVYVDVYGLGWQYDKTSGHKDDTDDSPAGQQWGMLIVPEEFAEQAETAFPDDCDTMTEDELEDFYDNKAHVHDPEELVDTAVLQGIKAKEDLGLDVPEKTKAVDPDDPAPGVRKNNHKTWSDFKSLKNVTAKSVGKAAVRVL